MDREILLKLLSDIFTRKTDNKNVFDSESVGYDVDLLHVSIALSFPMGYRDISAKVKLVFLDV